MRRRRLGEQIAAARQKAREGAAATGGSDADEIIPVEEVGKPLRAAAAAMMTMTSDPELGTVIDTEGITDAAGKPLAARLDEYLRDTIDSLAMPPLGRGGKVKAQYTFTFESAGGRGKVGPCSASVSVCGPCRGGGSRPS